MKEIVLPGLSARLKEEAEEIQRKAAYKIAEEGKKAARKQERINDVDLLQSSQVSEVFKEAAKLLEQGGHRPDLSVTNPDFSFGPGYPEEPINLKLAWDIEGRLDSHPLVGSDDYHGNVYSWKEANCCLVKDKEGILKGLKFNIMPSETGDTSFESNLSLDDIITAIDKAVTHPLKLDDEHIRGASLPRGNTASENERRISIIF